MTTSPIIIASILGGITASFIAVIAVRVILFLIAICRMPKDEWNDRDNHYPEEAP